MEVEKDETCCKKALKASYSDKLFLLNFVMSNYLGPDVYYDNPRYSSFHRFAKRLPPYTSNNLGSSFLCISQLESLYYYVVRNASSDLVVQPDLFYMYLKGDLPFPVEDHRQFTTFFPLNLHEHKKYSSDYEIVKGIVLIDDPVTTFMKEADLARFKYLSGIDDLRIHANECLGFRHGHRNGGDYTELPWLSHHECAESPIFGVSFTRRNQNIVDIGENENAYLFRVALPGVQRDFCEFSCDIKSNGEVQIEGTGSGGKIIRKRSRVFRLFIQQLWPTGPFTVSFKLPGPVDPRLFTPNFRNDGIFEGIVIKQK